jgi:hypothetical protein
MAAKTKARPAKRDKAPKRKARDDTRPRAQDAAPSPEPDAMVQMIAALAPILQSWTDFAKANADRNLRAVEASARADTASLTALAAAANALLSPHPRRPRPGVAVP